MSPRSLTAIAAISFATMLSSTAQAQDFAQVISSIPILERVQTPVEVCTSRQVTVERTRQDNVGAVVLGSIVGNAIGAATGISDGRTLGTVIGGIAGHEIGKGDSSTTGTKTVRDCHTETREETRVKSYRVTYEYAGKRYEIETPKDPGLTIPINVTPAIPLSQGPSSTFTASTTRLAHPSNRGLGRRHPTHTVIVGYNDIDMYTTGPYSGDIARHGRKHKRQGERRWDDHWYQ